MSKELEIEFRNMLTSDEYDHLIANFKLAENQFFEQTNYYLDTNHFALKERHAALRIRKVKNTYELTLKTPQDNGLLETTQILAEEQAEAIFNGANIPVGQVREMLNDIGVNHEDLIYFGSLQTIRAEISYKKGLLVFDKNIYGSVVDYNLEYEVADYNRGQTTFSQLLADYHIREEEAPNKIERFYMHLYPQDS